MGTTPDKENGDAGKGGPRRNPLRRQSSGTAGFQTFKFKKLSSRQDLTSLEYEAEQQKALEDLQVEAEKQSLAHNGSLLRDLLDVSPLLVDAHSAVVDDSFTRCFQGQRPDPWNWNAYLLPLWAAGVLLRHLVLFPIRVAFLLVAFLLFFVCFGAVQLLKDGPTKQALERGLVTRMCAAFCASWTAVIRYHGPKPTPRANHVWVANHTSMIDYIILCAYSPFAVIMQLHPGWVGFLQTRVISCLGCLWFNRTEVKDRKLVQQRMRQHVQAPDTTPLLIFPEGTCVNNEYCVMFKRGAFDLGATVCPVAIRYNKIFVDAFWNSRRQGFTSHLLKLMRSWAVVCDVYFLEPTSIREGESSAEFAERVQAAIAERASLKVAPWDGYLKYYNLAERHPDLVQRRQRLYADLYRKALTSSQSRGTAARAAALGATPSCRRRHDGVARWKVAGAEMWDRRMNRVPVARRPLPAFWFC